MAKKRVYEIAKDEGLPSGFVLQRLQRAGMPVKTASSTVDVDWALHLLNPNRHPQPATPHGGRAGAPGQACPGSRAGAGGRGAVPPEAHAPTAPPASADRDGR